MDKNVVKTQDDKEAIASFEKYFKKGLDGRYEVGLPFRKDSVSTDLRVVFNASSPGPNGVSLNDVLLPGPALQNDLVQILIRFRTHRIAITGDIKKMFCQTNIRKSDHRYQLFLWRGCDPNIPPQTYAMTTIMFGVTCSPFLAMNSVNKHVKSSEVVKMYPKACEEVSRNIFVDDVATGASDERGAIELCSSLQDLFQEGGWEITKFASNSTELMKTIPSDKRLPGIMVDLDDNLEGVSHTSTLGLKWDTSLDMLSCKVSANLIGQVQMDLPVTKRRILAYHASIYDVFGFFGPFIIRAKILMQALWKQKCSWDEVIEGKIAESFRKWCGEVPRLPEIGIPRWIGIISEDQKLELVGFGDASEVAYGAVVYARVVEPNGSVSISFMISKTRVAPLKFKSIARLELLGAHLLCRLMKFVEEALTYRVSAKTYFTDSSVVLSWLGKSSFEWKTFMKNRVQEIHNESAATDWHHCSGSDNPSDLLSRGASSSEIEQSLLYWEGPSWLKEDRGSWPNLFGDLSNNNILTMDQERCPQSSAMITTRLHYPEFLVKFSSFRKLLRVIARIMRWRNPVPSQGVDVNELSTEEIMNAEVQICRIIQGRHFPEFEVILEGRMISRDSNLLPLNPTLCPVRNVLITGDRIRLSDLPSEMKHPIILPPNDILVGLLIQSVHESHAHAAQETTLTILRNKYHIVHGRTEVRKVLRRCMVCRQYRTKPMQQRMGILPKERVSIAPAFTHVGLDFTGPLLIRSSSGVPRKAYICVFTCAASRGVHFELTNDMSTGEFLGALTRMINRRGKPSTIFSDNAKCFIKANKMLRQAYARVNRIEIDSGSLQRFLSNRDIKWKFISERAPHRGAFWERLNRSLKEPLRIILGRALLSYSEMMTVLTEIEASLNSRPLTYQDSDDGAKEPITPAHLMLGRPIVQISDLLGGSTSISKRYQFLTQVLDNFWRRWSREYIPTLMSRRKWQTVEVAPRIGDVCLISEENVKRPRWPMGVIIEAIAGSDGLVRTFKLRTTKGILCRPIQKLHLLVENRTKDEESDTALEEKISNSQKEELIFPLPVKDQGGEDIHNLVTRSGKRIPRRR